MKKKYLNIIDKLINLSIIFYDNRDLIGEVLVLEHELKLKVYEEMMELISYDKSDKYFCNCFKN